MSEEHEKLPKLEAEILKKRQAKDAEDPLKPKTKYPSFLQNLADYFTEYCDHTSIHGFRYFGEQSRSWFEKAWWVLVFAASLSMCTFLIIKIYEKWENSPVLVSFAKSPMPIWQIPFPAVTICSETKARQRYYNFTHYYHKFIGDNMTDEELSNFQKVILTCDSHLYTEGNKTTEYSTIDFLTDISPPFDEALWTCKWGNLNNTCDTMFSTVLTEEGVCFTFNMLDREEIFTNHVFHNRDYLAHGWSSNGWSLDFGYRSQETYPRRALAAGAKAGLTILLRAYEQDLDYICKGPVQGFKLLLHQPGEIPRASMQYIRAPLDQEIIVAVKPDMMTTSEALKGYEPHRRQCYFSSERPLKYYKNYTQQNCEVECLTNFTLASCGCVAYYMPHDEYTPICGSGSINCMTKAFNQILRLGAENEGSAQCDCLQACTSLVYNAETSQADFNWPALFTAFKANFSEFPGVKMTRITIFFKEMQFITSERNELYGSTDFLANCGGLLGLFTGFSFLSLVEILYFLSLRLMCNFKRHGRHYWSASPELINDDTYVHTK